MNRLELNPTTVEAIWQRHINTSPLEHMQTMQRRHEAFMSKHAHTPLHPDVLMRYWNDCKRKVIRDINSPYVNHAARLVETDPSFFSFIVDSARDYKIALMGGDFDSIAKVEMYGRCSHVSHPLAHWLNHRIKREFPKNSPEAVVVHGYFGGRFGASHYWVGIGSTVVDLTILQFSDYARLGNDNLEYMKSHVTSEGVFVGQNPVERLHSLYYPMSYEFTDISDEEKPQLDTVGQFISTYQIS